MKSIIFNIFSLLLLGLLFSGVKNTGGLGGLIFSGLVLSLFMMILKPMISIVTFPLTIITFGLYGLISNIVSVMVILYLLTRITTQFSVHPFIIHTVAMQNMVIPTLHLNLFFAFAVVSIMYLLLKGVFSWLTQE